MRFDVFDLFAKYGLVNGVSLRDPEVGESFLAAARTSIQRALEDERFLHGQRTQAMFEALVASLGRVLILKQEDAGDVYISDETLSVPDFRLVLPDGVQMLVEVKNVYQGGPDFPSLKLSTVYLDGLVRYAAQMNCDLKVAVYWAQRNVWTLSAPAAFQQQGEYRLLSMEGAMFANEMAFLGDMMVGTKFPLRLRLYNDSEQSGSIDESGRSLVVIADVEIFCAEQLITDPVERDIAFRFMLFGDWHEEDEVSVGDNRIEWIEFRYGPLGDSGQPFAIIGSLSGMFSRAYGLATIDEGGVTQLRQDNVPGYWGRLIPEGYKGQALPIWRFVQKPSFLAAAGSWKDVDTEKLKAELYASRQHASRPSVEL
jgi:hypothetical protein